LLLRYRIGNAEIVFAFLIEITTIQETEWTELTDPVPPGFSQDFAIGFSLLFAGVQNVPSFVVDLLDQSGCCFSYYFHFSGLPRELLGVLVCSRWIPHRNSLPFAGR
jgi:hypothetical protein